jgi:hypothetical protein
MKYFDTRDDMIAEFIKPGMVCCEIGTFKGEFAKKMSALNPQVVVCIDGFHHMMASGDQDGNNVTEVFMPTVYEELCKEAEKYRFVIARGWSFDVLPTLPNEIFDFIYVDADHSYEGCKRDLILCSEKIKKGGIIAGHDYFVNIAKHKGDFSCGVGKAVNEFCEERGWEVIALGMDGCVSYALKKKDS